MTELTAFLDQLLEAAKCSTNHKYLVIELPCQQFILSDANLHLGRISLGALSILGHVK